MRRALHAALAAAAILTATASPATAGESLRGSHAAVLWTLPPSPSPFPDVHLQGCPTDPTADCYIGGAGYNDVYLTNPDNEWVVQHELGHAYDRQDLDDGERHRIARALDWRVWHPEAFADFYAGCRRALDPRDYFVREDGVYGRWHALRSVARRCRLIAVAATPAPRKES
jgi:hypothetical protein